MIGPHAEPFDLRFTLPDGSTAPSAHLILVSNNPYQLSTPRGSVPEGASTMHPRNRCRDVPRLEGAGTLHPHVRLRQGEPSPGLAGVDGLTFEVHSAGPIEVGIDGEAMMLDPPIRFRSVPAALRVRLPRHAPGYSPAALTPPWAFRDHGVVAYGPRQSGADRRLMSDRGIAVMRRFRCSASAVDLFRECRG